MKKEPRKQGKKNKQDKTDSSGGFYRYSYVLVIIVPVLLYIGSLSAGFVYLDDDILVLDNYPKISHVSTTIEAFKRDVFLSNTYPYYRPMLNVALIIQAKVGGNAPFIYHFGNLVLHILCCLSLLWLLHLFGFSKSKSLAGTLLFAIHPLMSKAVLFIPAQNDLLVALFGLISTGYFIRFYRESKYYLALVSLLAFALALFSKESAAVLPFLLVLYLFLTKQNIFDKRVFLMAGGWGLIIAFWFFLRSLAIGPDTANQTGLDQLVKNLPFPFEIISKFIIPFKLAVMPVFSSWSTITGAVLVLAILIFIILKKEYRNPFVIFGVAWFIVFALPNMYARINNAVDNFDYLEHRAYLPAVGLIVVFLSLVPDNPVPSRKRIILWIAGSVLVLFSLLTLFQQKYYDNGLDFWNSAVSDSPEKPRFIFQLGRYYFRQNDYVEFEKCLNKAIILKEDPEFFYQLGMVNWVAKKDYDKAFYYFQNSVDKVPGVPEAKSNYVSFLVESSQQLFKKGDYQTAAERCKIALKLDPSNAVAWVNLGTDYIFMGEKKAAAGMWKKALSLNPGLKDAYCNLYLYYKENTKLQDSVSFYGRKCSKYGGAVDTTNLKP
jgi:protein O-mannosyl-transferase